jgi:hypothetical protein
MIGAFALTLLGASSSAFAEDGDQNIQNLYTGYNASAVTAPYAVRNAQASIVTGQRQGVQPFTQAEANWFERATPSTDVNN